MINTHGSADSQQLRMMTEVLHAYCGEFGIEAGSDGAEGVARRIMQLFANGAETREALDAALRQNVVHVEAGWMTKSPPLGAVLTGGDNG